MVHFLSKNSKRFFFPSAKTFAIPTTTYSEGFHSGFSISALLISLYISKTRAITIPILGSLVLDKLASPCLPTLLRLFLFSSCDLFRRAFFFCAPPNLRDNSFFMGFWYSGFTVIVQSSLNALHLPPSTIILKWDVKWISSVNFSTRYAGLQEGEEHSGLYASFFLVSCGNWLFFLSPSLIPFQNY